MIIWHTNLDFNVKFCEIICACIKYNISNKWVLKYVMQDLRMPHVIYYVPHTILDAPIIVFSLCEPNEHFVLCSYPIFWLMDTGKMHFDVGNTLLM